MEKRQAWGDYSPLHGQDPHAMQVDEPPGHHQEPAKGLNPYAPKVDKNNQFSRRGVPRRKRSSD
jgi:hypothetical protein